VPQFSNFTGGNIVFGSPLAVNGQTLISATGQVTFNGNVTLGTPPSAQSNPFPTFSGIPYPVLEAIAPSFTGANITLDGTTLSDGSKSGTVALVQVAGTGSTAAVNAYGNLPVSSAIAAAAALLSQGITTPSQIGALTAAQLATKGINIGYGQTTATLIPTPPTTAPLPPTATTDLGLTSLIAYNPVSSNSVSQSPATNASPDVLFPGGSNPGSSSSPANTKMQLVVNGLWFSVQALLNVLGELDAVFVESVNSVGQNATGIRFGTPADGLNFEHQAVILSDMTQEQQADYVEYMSHQNTR
jgi:hypothetical protein